VRHLSTSHSTDEAERSRDTSGSVWWTSIRPSRESSAPVVAVSGGGSGSRGGGGDMFMAILLGCAGAFVVIVGVIGVIVVLRWRSKRSAVERSPLKTCSLSNTRCTNFSLNYLSPSPAPISYAATAKVRHCRLAGVVFPWWTFVDKREFNMHSKSSKSQLSLIHNYKSANVLFKKPMNDISLEIVRISEIRTRTKSKTFYTYRNLFLSFLPQLLFNCYLVLWPRDWINTATATYVYVLRRTKLHPCRVLCCL